MREIKFRAWDTDEKYMYPLKERPNLELFPFPRYTLMQFTGLKDKNGKDIYEGDVVIVYKHHRNDEEFRGSVEYGPNARFTVNILNDDRVDGVHQSFGNPAYPFNLEVIGNIYENSELLKS